MKYFIRSVKYLVYFTVMCGIILVLTFHFSTKPEGLTLMDMLMVEGSIYKMLAFFVAMYAFKAPDSPIVWWCSMIPFTSPIVMLARIPYGVPMWELALSISILAATFVGCAWLSAKIYKIGILMFGKKTTFKDLWKWLNQK